MRLKINGIKREVIIMQAPQGSFYYDEDLCEPQFPMYIGMCEPLTKEEETYGDVIVFPIDGGYNDGYECIEPKWILNHVSPDYLRRLLINYTSQIQCDNLKDAVEPLMNLFEIHKTPIPLPVRKYVDDVMNGIITKIPTNG